MSTPREPRESDPASTPRAEPTLLGPPSPPPALHETLEAPAPAVPLAMAETLASPPVASAPPPQIDVRPAPLREEGNGDERYEQGDTLGQGGMGEVWLCRDRRLGREVARKVMRPEAAAKPGTLERFLREVRVQGQLEHPSVVPVYDLGVTSAGEAYFTMKRVRGVTLHEVLEGLRADDPAL